MADLFDEWCEATELEEGRKLLCRMTEADGTRTTALQELRRRIQSHYVSDEEIAAFLDTLDYGDVAELVRLNYPESARGRSGDLGEILATELIEEWCGYDVPIRKLRYKDHRDQAMRGEDVIGARHDKNGQLELLKAEAKSAQSLSTATVAEARAGLEAHHGRPSPHALMFTARKLLEAGTDIGDTLGRELLQTAIEDETPKSKVAHLLFALTGNAALDMIDTDFDNADGERNQYIAHFRIRDHGEFVGAAYNAAVADADD